MCLKVLVAKAKWGIITIFMLSRHKQLQSIIYNPGIILQNKPPEINLIGNFFVQTFQIWRLFRLCWHLLTSFKFRTFSPALTSLGTTKNRDKSLLSLYIFPTKNQNIINLSVSLRLAYLNPPLACHPYHTSPVRITRHASPAITTKTHTPSPNLNNLRVKVFTFLLSAV